MSQPNYDLDTFSLDQVSLRPGLSCSGSVTKNGLSVDMTSTVGPVSSVCSLGTKEGAPTSITIVFELEESSDESVWTDMAPRTNVSLSADDSTAIGKGTRTKRFARIVATSTATGGSSPTAPICGIIFAQKIHAPS